MSRVFSTGLRDHGAIQGMELRPPPHQGVVAIEKGAFGSPSTKVANFTYLLFVISDYTNRIYNQSC